MQLILDELGAIIKDSDTRQYFNLNQVFDMFSMLAKSTKKITLLPSNTLAHKYDAGKGIIAFQFNPMRRLVSCYTGRDEDDDYDNDAVTDYTIPIPYIILVVEYGKDTTSDRNIVYEVKLLASPEPITDMSDMLYYVPFGNIYDQSTVCWGGSLPVSSFNNFSELLPTYDVYFDTVFNDDLNLRMNPSLGIDCCGQLCEYLYGRDTLPKEVLLSTGLTLSKFMEM